MLFRNISSILIEKTTKKLKNKQLNIRNPSLPSNFELQMKSVTLRIVCLNTFCKGRVEFYVYKFKLNKNLHIKTILQYCLGL